MWVWQYMTWCYLLIFIMNWHDNSFWINLRNFLIMITSYCCNIHDPLWNYSFSGAVRSNHSEHKNATEESTSGRWGVYNKTSTFFSKFYRCIESFSCWFGYRHNRNASCYLLSEMKIISCYNFAGSSLQGNHLAWKPTRSRKWSNLLINLNSVKYCFIASGIAVVKSLW